MASIAAVGIVFGSQLVIGTAAPAAVVKHQHRTPPTPLQVESDLTGVANTRSIEIGSPARLVHMSCISASPGSYACSYVRIVPPNPGSCALAVLEWTPDSASTYTVKTAGRVALPPEKCGPVKKVLHVLGTSG